jgi:hypothetical protein
VLNKVLSPCIVKASSKPMHHCNRPIGSTKKQGSGIRGNRASVERGHNPAAFNGFKSKQFRHNL